MRPARRIVLLGFMAAGKTSVARALARALGCGWVDLDGAISERENATIRELIDARGEEAFRAAEGSTLGAILEGADARVIALGGGAWTVESNRDLIARHGCLTVWLDAPFELCWQRIEREEGTRPLAPDRAAAHRRYRERLPLYETARLRLRVREAASAEETAAEVLKLIRAAGAL